MNNSYNLRRDNKWKYYTLLLTAGLDNLLAESFESTIKDNLGNPMYQVIKNKLKELYGISVLDAIRDFTKIDLVLRELLGENANGIEENFLNAFIEINPSNRNRPWITIRNQSLANQILASFTDPEKRLILDNSMNKPEIIMNIINNCKLPKSTGYRLIKELSEQGLLVEESYDLAKDGRKMTRYTSLFENVKAEIQGGKTILKVQISKDFLKKSTMLQVNSSFYP